MNLLETVFPELVDTGYAVTSPPTPEYNCIGWAAGEDDRWWWPDAAGVSYWPTGVPREETIAAFAAAFATIGFAPSTNPNLEPDVIPRSPFMLVRAFPLMQRGNFLTGSGPVRSVNWKTSRTQIPSRSQELTTARSINS